jgi:hypothetical protein
MSKDTPSPYRECEMQPSTNPADPRDPPLASTAADPATAAPHSQASTLRPGFGRRLGIALCLALVVAYAFMAFNLVRNPQTGGPEGYVRQTDFLIVLTGSAVLAEGHPQALYDEQAQTAAQARLLRAVGREPLRLLPFNHPPFEALLTRLLQLAGLTAPGIFALWTVLSCVAIGLALVALRWAWPVSGQPGLLLTLAALTFFPLTGALLLGQSTPLILLGWAAGSAALRRGYDGWAGVALALAAIKPQAVPVLLLALLLMRRWRTLLTWTVTIGAAVLAAMPFLGLDWPVRYLRFVLAVAAWPPSPALDPAFMQNWRGLFIRLLGDGSLAGGLAVAATVLSLALVALIWAGPGAARAAGWRPGTPGWDRRWAMTLFIALLVNPHLLPHDLTPGLVPVWILAAALLPAAPRAGIAWLWAGWVAGFAAMLYSNFPLSPAVLWLIVSVALLLWRILQQNPPTSLLGFRKAY